jgi:hypothetical protein
MNDLRRACAAVFKLGPDFWVYDDVRVYPIPRGFRPKVKLSVFWDRIDLHRAVVWGLSRRWPSRWPLGSPLWAILARVGEGDLLALGVAADWMEERGFGAAAVLSALRCVTGSTG